MAKCKECGGDGEKFILPRGNPFNMRLPQLAQSMVKVRCRHCNGTGNVNQQIRTSDGLKR
jgi:DnaJ-class molecular chaperone